ncbi:hypothetical protein G6011_01995 [Alternaria panax]|uniref:Uncharacterized protein n=1 Tax=Alternaria panax TaxID=48097 RepID=A0AAD4FDY2_9PLEO|nr:hypothetical protein G6011_01995 [Alternaria panax]
MVQESLSHQEIALGKTALVVYGNKVFPWETLSKILSFVKTTRWYHRLHAEKLKHMKEMLPHLGIYKQVSKSKLEVGISHLNLNFTRLTASFLTVTNSQVVNHLSFRDVVDKHRFAECSNPRDKTSLLIDELEDLSAAWASIVSLALSLDFPYPVPGATGKIPSHIEVLWQTPITDIYNHTYPAPPEPGSLFIDYILNLQIRHHLTP